MEATSAPPILLPGIDHLPCLQEIRSVKDKPFYCQSSVGTIPFQGRVFLLLAFCKQNASLQQLLSHMATVSLSTNCPRANSIIKSSWPHELGKVELGATWIWHGLVPGKCWLNALQKNCGYARRYALYTIGLAASDSGQSWSLFWSLSWSLLWS